MKKNLFFGLFATMMLLLTTACQKENDLLGNGEATISFEISTPQMATRAFSDGNTATKLWYAVYHKDGEGYELLRKVGTAELDGKKARVDVQLATGKTYSVLFWAQADGAPFVLDYDNLTMSVTYGKCNDENYDAFYWFKEVEVNGTATVGVTLTRPFAQLNIGTKDLENIDDVSVAKTAVTVENVYNTFNFASGNVQGTATSVTFTSNDRPAAETFPVTGYEYLAMNYILVQKEGEVLNEVILTYDNGNKSRSFTNIPVKANHRTNIYGALLTSNVGFDVEIEEDFDKPDENVEVWDGKKVTEPAYNDETDTYTVTTGAELAWLAALVNGTLPAEVRSEEFAPAENLKGVTITLTKDIDLGGKEWTPIGDSEHIFKGTFDGDGKVVKNLVITGNNSNVGLFGVTHEGEIKNFTVENAKVSGRLNVGVVAGQPYTSKYTGITVTGHVEVNGMAYVGGVGGKNAYADWTNVTVNADETSYVKANSVENGTAYRTYVGGVVGFNGEGGHKFSNITSNINVEGSTCDVGGLFGIAHYGNQFENCACTGNVEIYAAEEADEAQEIGGIAGVWNNGGENVVLTNCRFGGELITNIEGVDFYYGGLVGAPYSATGNGKLIIDGLEFTTEGVSFEVINEILADGNGFVFPFDLVGKAEASNAYGKTGINVKNGQTIDGNGYTLDIKGAGGTWDSGISTTGGLIKDIKVTGSFRGIFVNHNSDHAEKVILNNVTIDGPVYTISCDQGTEQGLEAVNSTFNGWTSYAATIGNVTFTECNFGEGAGYAFCRPYAPTVFTDCDFAEGYEIDARAKVTFDNCYLDGEPITAENYTELVTSNQGNVAFPVNVSSAAALTEALGKGVSVVLDADIDYGTTQLAITGENQVVDLGGHTLTTANNWGGISLKNGATIKNGTITHAGNTAAIKAFNGSSVENVSINATCSTADKTVTGIAVQQGANVESIKNVTINGVSQGIEVGYQATVGLIENAVVNESNNGTAHGIGLVINGGKVGKAKNCTFKGETYGVTLHLKGVFAAGLDLENCKVEGTTASIYAWDEKGISNTSGSLVLTYDKATKLTGSFVWDFEDECKSVVTLNKPE